MTAIAEKMILETHPLNYGLSVSDAVWITTAMLQRESQRSGGPSEGFEPEVLRALVVATNLTKAEEGSIAQHIRQHCVANKPAQPNRSCMLFATDDRRRRLYRKGDYRHPSREGAPDHPKWDHLPNAFIDLKDWYETVWNSPSAIEANDPLLNAIGTGRDIWKDIGADVYVNELREGWGDRG